MNTAWEMVRIGGQQTCGCTAVRAHSRLGTAEAPDPARLLFLLRLIFCRSVCLSTEDTLHPRRNQTSVFHEILYRRNESELVSQVSTRASDCPSSPHFAVWKKDDNVWLGLGAIMVTGGQGEGGRCQRPVFNISVSAELAVRGHRGREASMELTGDE